MRYLFICFIFLSACNTPSPAFRGLPYTRISVEESTFDVRISGQRAEAIRINQEYAPRFGVIRHRAAYAMARVSGCRVVTVTGDQAQAFGRLACGKRRVIERDDPMTLDCVPVRGSGIREIGQIRIDLDCDAA
ncbi:hypothetical protein OS190_03540 [Sulfitobacter sp. F26204]|uniref:hypothetical protein n=1 Tax=Sulfitobacter sp. F26204 TaxID=2996014 RepID=UPI00225DE803|nr:hypothetical protein [Sulfitobacter sp. F26204]MCX7558625.1 hypothetical protein [Sulfitobacter sp. F26204]